MKFLGKSKYSTWLILFVVLIILVFNASNWYIYSKIKFFLTQQLGERLANIASATAFGIDAENITRIKSKIPPLAGEGEKAYQDMESFLENIKENNQLADAFILDQDYHNVLEPTSDPTSEVFLNLDLVAITQALTGTKTHSHLYQVGDYYFESGFAPIYDSTGEVIAVLGVEADADFFQVLSSFKKTLIGAFVLSLLGIVILGIFFYNLSSHTRKMEDALIKSSALQAMGEMVATISHEIRNPLGIIKGTAERLSKKYDKNQDELFAFIPEEVNRLNEILTGYLEFASLEPKRKEEEDLASFFNKTIDQIRNEFSKQNITIKLEADENLPKVKINPVGIKQVIINLLMNAKEAITQDGHIKIKLQSQKDFVCIEIKDNGRGIKKKDLKQIFTPFFSTKPKGSGLGLYVVKKIVEEHGGSISVESEVEKGTKVKIKLPIGSTSTDLSCTS
ncbi:MAG: HAMP domain-containing histidine kinase, partial [candidate division Zixibacteria bacterium]|nr:HAMP domain-containing histidine kinase [candidate division Zixibacteria bacterium]